MSSDASGFDQFGVKNWDSKKTELKVEQVKARRKISAAASGKSEKGSSAPAVPTDVPSAAVVATNKDAEVPFRKRPVSRDTAARLLGDKTASTADDGDENDRRTAIRKYRAYYCSKHTNRFCSGVPPNDNWSLPVALANLERVRETSNAQAQLDLTPLAIEKCIVGAEYAVHTMGINPLDWQLIDKDGVRASQVFRANKDSEEFQPALDEVGAELGLALKSNCYMRLGHALYGFLQGFSDAAKNKRARVEVVEQPETK